MDLFLSTAIPTPRRQCVRADSVELGMVNTRFETMELGGGAGTKLKLTNHRTACRRWPIFEPSRGTV